MISSSLSGTTPTRVAVLSSARAPGLEALLDAARYGGEFEVAAFVASDPDCADLELAASDDVFVVTHDIRAWHRARGLRWSDLSHRARYDAETVALLRAAAVDMVMCLGYLHVLSGPMLAAFPGRIVNLHDSDLAVRDAGGTPRYRGLRSTFDAIAAGETVTRSTAHLVTEDVDVGPVIARSWPFPVHALAHDARVYEAEDMLKAYAFAHREWMMRSSWGALAVEAVRAIANGDVHVAGTTAVVRGRIGGVELTLTSPRQRRPIPAPARTARVAYR